MRAPATNAKQQEVNESNRITKFVVISTVLSFIALALLTAGF